MGACKEFVDLKISGSGLPFVDVDASVDFETEVVEWATDHLWSAQVHDYNITGNNAEMSLMVSNIDNAADFIPYKILSTNFKINDLDNRGICDEDMPFKYFKWVYESNGASGTFSFNMMRMQDN